MDCSSIFNFNNADAFRGFIKLIVISQLDPLVSIDNDYYGTLIAILNLFADNILAHVVKEYNVFIRSVFKPTKQKGVPKKD